MYTSSKICTYFLKRNDMSTTFLQQILNGTGRLLLVVTVRAKK